MCFRPSCFLISSTGFLLFINNRFVEHSGLKRVVDDVYSRVLPRGVKPFVCLSIDIDPSEIDVNVHPTKARVDVLHEDELLDLVGRMLRTNVLCTRADTDVQRPSDHRGVSLKREVHPLSSPLATKPRSKNSSREMMLTEQERHQGDGYESISSDLNCSVKHNEIYSRHESVKGSSMYPQPVHLERKHGRVAVESQSLRRTLNLRVAKEKDAAISNYHSFAPRKGSQRTDPSKGVRTNPRDRPIEAFFAKRSCLRCGAIATTKPGAFADLGSCRALLAGLPACTCGTRFGPLIFRETLCSYDSISGLNAGFHQGTDAEFAIHLRESVYVGIIDDRWLLAQHGTSLVAYDHRRLAYALFYQLTIRRFGRTPSLDLTSNPLDIRTALDAVAPTENRAHAAANLLFSKASLLAEYFHIKIRDAHLIALPELLPGHTPTPAALPCFLFDLATKVDWDHEEPCFVGVAQVLAQCYATLPCAPIVDAHTKTSREVQNRFQVLDNLLRLCFFPAFRLLLLPPKLMRLNVCLELTSHERLFRVFERC